jgi:hypothetical protein
VVFSNSSEEVLLSTVEEIFDASNPTRSTPSSDGLVPAPVLSSSESKPSALLPRLVQPSDDIEDKVFGEVSPTSVSGMHSPTAPPSGQILALQQQALSVLGGDDDEVAFETDARESSLSLDPQQVEVLVEESFNTLSSPRVSFHSSSAASSKNASRASLEPLVDDRAVNAEDVQLADRAAATYAQKRLRTRGPCPAPNHPLFKDIGGDCKFFSSISCRHSELTIVC